MTSVSHHTRLRLLQCSSICKVPLVVQMQYIYVVGTFDTRETKKFRRIQHTMGQLLNFLQMQMQRSLLQWPADHIADSMSAVLCRWKSGQNHHR